MLLLAYTLKHGLYDLTILNVHHYGVFSENVSNEKEVLNHLVKVFRVGKGLISFFIRGYECVFKKIFLSFSNFR